MTSIMKAAITSISISLYPVVDCDKLTMMMMAVSYMSTKSNVMIFA